jgi:hypothetical protein
MISTHMTNQTTSLSNHATCMQETKQKSVHLLSLARVSHAHRYGRARHMRATKQAVD